MNVRFNDPFEDSIRASATTTCGTITVTDPSDGGSGGENGDSGGGGVTDPQPPSGGDSPLSNDTAILGGVAVLVVLIVALTRVV